MHHYEDLGVIEVVLYAYMLTKIQFNGKILKNKMGQ